MTGSLAVVDQDIILFEDTVANNITMWDSTIENYEHIYMEALHRGDNEDFNRSLEELEDKYLAML